MDEEAFLQCLANLSDSVRFFIINFGLKEQLTEKQKIILQSILDEKASKTAL